MIEPVTRLTINARWISGCFVWRHGQHFLGSAPLMKSVKPQASTNEDSWGTIVCLWVWASARTPTWARFLILTGHYANGRFWFESLRTGYWKPNSELIRLWRLLAVLRLIGWAKTERWRRFLVCVSGGTCLGLKIHLILSLSCWEVGTLLLVSTDRIPERLEENSAESMEITFRRLKLLIISLLRRVYSALSRISISM